MTAFNKQLPKPDWLTREHKNKNTQRGQRYYLHLWNAQPDWQDPKPIRKIYRRCKAMRQAGHDVEVDHIIPLNHPLICGLHVPLNLRITERQINAIKSNNYYPGMAYEQRDLFHQQIAPLDFSLEVQNAVDN